MMRPGIEPRSPGPLVNYSFVEILSIWSYMSVKILYFYNFKSYCFWNDLRISLGTDTTLILGRSANQYVDNPVIHSENNFINRMQLKIELNSHQWLFLTKKKLSEQK